MALEDFLGIALRFGLDYIIGNLAGGGPPAQIAATWGDTAGPLGSFTYNASAALTPQTGFTVSASFIGDGGGSGGLSGTALASLFGNCNAAICDGPFLPGPSSYIASGNMQITPGPGPAPIPLPAPVLLLGSALLGLFGLRLRRRAGSAVTG